MKLHAEVIAACKLTCKWLERTQYGTGKPGYPAAAIHDLLQLTVAKLEGRAPANAELPRASRDTLAEAGRMWDEEDEILAG